MSSHFLYNGLNTFYFFSCCLFKNLIEFGTRYCNIRVAFLHIYPTNFRDLKSSFLTKEPDYITLTDFVFLPLSDIDCYHTGQCWLGKNGRNIIGFRFILDIFRNILFRSKNEKGLSCCIPARGTPYVCNCLPFPADDNVLYCLYQEC